MTWGYVPYKGPVYNNHIRLGSDSGSRWLLRFALHGAIVYVGPLGNVSEFPGRRDVSWFRAYTGSE